MPVAKKDFKNLLVIVVVISFVISSIVGFFAGTLGSVDIEQLTKVLEEKLSLPETREDSREEKIVKIVKEASPVVVSIIITKDLPVIERYYEEYNPFEGDDFFEQFFNQDFFSPFVFRIPKERQKGTEQKEIGGGTGFIISQEGLILTNKHVVSDKEANYTVLTTQGEKFPAEILAADPIRDIAILKVKKENLPVLSLADSDQIQIGQTVIAIGNALGEFRNTVSVGVVSGLKRSIIASSGFGQAEILEEVIQTDAAINRGNSGGPLLNLNGQVIGINVAMATGAENIGFSIPINQAKKGIEDVKTYGRIIYPFLGIHYDSKTYQVQEVIPGTAAEKAGLKSGDIILEIDDHKLDHDYTLAEAILKHQVSDKIKLKIKRGEEEKIIYAQLGEMK